MKSLLGKLGVILFIIGLIIFGYGCPVVNIANAQCAWVLWLKQHNQGWEILSAFPTYQECQEAQKRSFLYNRDNWKQAKKFNDLPVKEVKVTDVPFSWMSVWIYFESGKEEFGTTFEYKCLPDTIDPRK